MNETLIKFDDDLSVKLVRSSRRRTVLLTVNKNYEIEVRAPLNTSISVIKEFVNKNRSWAINKIKERKDFVSKHSDYFIPKDFVDGSSVVYEGEKYSLKISDRSDIEIFKKDGFLYFPQKFLTYAKQYFIIWLKHQAFKKAIKRAEYFSDITKLAYSEVRITSAKGIWGSCSSKKKLAINWRLILAPSDVFDYIVVHEIVHLLIRNHSKSFWNKVEEFIPSYKAHEEWLKEHGDILML